MLEEVKEGQILEREGGLGLREYIVSQVVDHNFETNEQSLVLLGLPNNSPKVFILNSMLKVHGYEQK